MSNHQKKINMKNEVLYLLLNNYADHEAVFLASAIARDAGKRRRIVKTVYPGIFESDSRDGRRTVLCG